METDSYITIDLKGFLTMRGWRFKIAFHWTKKWICTNLLLANYMATATLDYLFFQYKMPFFTYYFVLCWKGEYFSVEFVIPRLWSRVKGNYQMPGCISRVEGRGARRDDGCPRRLSGSVMFKCLLSVGFSKKDLDRAKFVSNWLPRVFLLIVVVVISK